MVSTRPSSANCPVQRTGHKMHKIARPSSAKDRTEKDRGGQKRVGEGRGRKGTPEVGLHPMFEIPWEISDEKCIRLFLNSIQEQVGQA